MKNKTICSKIVRGSNLLILALFICALSPDQHNNLRQANLDYSTDMNALDAIADDYEDNPGFQELLMQIPQSFPPYEDLIKRGDDVSSQFVQNYMRDVSLLTQCVSILDENIIERLPKVCIQLKTAKPITDINRPS